MPLQQIRPTHRKDIISSINSKHLRELEESRSCWQDPTLFWNKWIFHTETHTHKHTHKHTHTHTHTHRGTTVFPSNTGTLILSPHLGLSLQTIAFLHVLRKKKIVWSFLLSHAFHIPCPSHIPRFGHLNNVEWRSSSLCTFLHSAITSWILGPHILFSQHSKTLVLRDKPKILRRWSITEVAGTHPWRRKQKYLAVQHFVCVLPLIRKTTLYTHIPNTSGWAQASNFTDRVMRNVTCSKNVFSFPLWDGLKQALRH
jgi:hypothetical protein